MPENHIKTYHQNRALILILLLSYYTIVDHLNMVRSFGFCAFYDFRQDVFDVSNVIGVVNAAVDAFDNDDLDL